MTRRQRIARAICASKAFETGEGVCALLCLDQLGDARRKGCPHAERIHGRLTAAIERALDDA